MHRRSSSIVPLVVQPQFVTEAASFSSTPRAGYDTPLHLHSSAVPSRAAKIAPSPSPPTVLPDARPQEAESSTCEGAADQLLRRPHYITEDLLATSGAVVTWVTIEWPKSKIYVIGTFQSRFPIRPKRLTSSFSSS